MGKKITPVEQYVIDKVRDIRKEKKISQAKLAGMIDVSSTFIGDVENYKKPYKYNLNHINKIAEALECRVWDLLPEKPLKSEE